MKNKTIGFLTNIQIGRYIILEDILDILNVRIKRDKYYGTVIFLVCEDEFKFSRGDGRM